MDDVHSLSVRCVLVDKMNPARLLRLLLQLCHGGGTSEKHPGVNEKRDESIKNARRERKRQVKYIHME